MSASVCLSVCESDLSGFAINHLMRLAWGSVSEMTNFVPYGT